MKQGRGVSMWKRIAGGSLLAASVAILACGLLVRVAAVRVSADNMPRNRCYFGDVCIMHCGPLQPKCRAQEYSFFHEGSWFIASTPVHVSRSGSRSSRTASTGTDWFEFVPNTFTQLCSSSGLSSAGNSMSNLMCKSPWAPPPFLGRP